MKQKVKYVEKRFKLPKFAKGDRVFCPSGSGEIEDVTLEGGQTWYCVEGVYYSGGELTLIERAKPAKKPKTDDLPF